MEGKLHDSGNDDAGQIRKRLGRGKNRGRTSKLILQVIRKFQKGKSVEETAEDLEEDISVIEPIYDAVKKSAPEYNVEEIYRKLNENG